MNTSTERNTTRGGPNRDWISGCWQDITILIATKFGVVDYLDECVNQRHGILLNITNANQETMAHIGAKNDKLDVVKWCLKQDRDFFLNSRDKMYNTVLHAAVLGSGSTNMVDLIVSQGVPILYKQNARGFTVLHEAAIHDRREMLAHLIDQHHMPLMNSNVAIIVTEFKQVSSLTFLLEKEPRLAHSSSECNVSLLHRAAQQGLLNVTELLCQKYGVKNQADCHGEFPINTALRKQSFETAAELVRDCNVDYLQPMSQSSRDTSAHWAARYGQIAILKNLDDKNVTYQDRQNDLGQIPITLAVENGNVETVEYLIRKGAPINITDNAGNTILHYTACNQPLKMVRYLFEKQYETIFKLLDERNKAGATSVFEAVKCDNLHFVQYLVEYEENLAIPTNNLETVLMAAVKRNNLTMVEYLINRPYAEPLLEDKYGKRAPDYSTSKGMTNFFKVHLPDISVETRRANSTGNLIHRNDSKVVERENFGSLKPLLDITLLPQGENLAHFAARKDLFEMLRWLIEETTVDFIRRPDSLNNTILHAAAFGGSARIVDYVANSTNSKDFLLQENADGFNALHVAAAQGHQSAAEVLVDRWHVLPGIRTAQTNDTAALLAAKHNHNRLLTWLLRKEPRIAPALGECKSNILNWVVFHDNLGMVSTLCREYGVRGTSDCHGDYPIHVAFRNLNYVLVNVLVDACEENLLQKRSDHTGDTTAHEATRMGRLGVLRFLDKRGKGGRDGYPEMTNDVGHTPIFLAVENNHAHIVEFLVNVKKVRLDGIDSRGNTIVHLTACHSDLNIFNYLREQWPDGLRSSLTKKNNADETVFHKAVACDNLELVRYLTHNFRARDMDVVTSDNKTAFVVAIMRDNLDMVKFLIQNGLAEQPANCVGRDPFMSAKSWQMKYYLHINYHIVQKWRNVTADCSDNPPPWMVSHKRVARMADRLDYPRLETSTNSTSVSILETGFLSNTFLLLDTILKKIFGWKSDYGSGTSDFPLSPPEVVRSKIDPLALEAVHQSERFEDLNDDNENNG